MTAPTPFVVTKSGKVHVDTCGVGGHGLPISLDALVDKVGPLHLGYSAPVTADCCGASPISWLKHNYPHIGAPS